MYDLYLPLKFHKKGRLEIEDKLQTGFYVLDGQWLGEFPFLDTLIKDNISKEYTAYFIDYTPTIRLTRISRPTNTVTATKIRRRVSMSTSSILYDDGNSYRA